MALILFSTTSCKKEILTDERQQPTPQLREKLGKICLKPIKIFCDSILWFDDEQHYEMVYQCLEQAYEAHNDWFDQQTQNMSDEDAEAHAASIGFNEDQPLMDFEAFQNFYSYRRWLRGLEVTLANQGQNPLDFDFLLDDIEATLTSRSRCIRIGDVTIYHYNDDEVFTTNSSDCQLINRLIRDPHQTIIENQNDVNVQVLKKTFSQECNFYLYEKGSKTVPFFYANNKRASFCKVKFRKTIAFNQPYPYVYKCASKVINFRRTFSGIYIPSKTNMKIGAAVGYYTLANCNINETISGEKDFKKRFRRFIKLGSGGLIGTQYKIFIRNYAVFGLFEASVNDSNYPNHLYIDNLN